MDEQAEWYTPGSLERARHQRDAARAEVAALRERLADEFIQMLFSAPMSRLRDDDGTQYVHRDEAINLARRVGRGA